MSDSFSRNRSGGSCRIAPTCSRFSCEQDRAVISIPMPTPQLIPQTSQCTYLPYPYTVAIAYTRALQTVLGMGVGWTSQLKGVVMFAHGAMPDKCNRIRARSKTVGKQQSQATTSCRSDLHHGCFPYRDPGFWGFDSRRDLIYGGRRSPDK